MLRKVLVGVDGTPSARSTPTCLCSAPPAASPTGAPAWGARGARRCTAPAAPSRWPPTASPPPRSRSRRTPVLATELRVGEPAEELTAAAADADLLVVGSRRWGPFSRLVVGSTGEELVREAPCSLLLVPRSAETEPAAGDPPSDG